MLYVTMEPAPSLALDQFHEWYNNEHGPTRLRIPTIFPNGLRYRATDGQAPHFLAAYDVTDMALLETDTYLCLRANRSPREAATIGQVAVDRHFLDLLHDDRAPAYVAPEHLDDGAALGRVLVSVEVQIRPDVPAAEAETVRWYKDEHIPMLRRVPGWLRSRVYRTPSAIEPAGSQQPKIVTLHEYEATNGLGGPEHKASMDTPWRTDVFANYLGGDKKRRVYELFYIFGPAPRELESLSRLPASAAFADKDGLTRTTPGAAGDAVVESYVTVRDGAQIRYRLEGNPSPAAPTVAFSNSLLTDLHMWDPLVALIKAARPDLRLLRYDTRGRHAVPAPPVPATLDMVADDLADVVRALRIPQLAALVGVSMGGATTLKFALKYPALVAKFVACDFNVASSDANTEAWKGRIAVAEGEGGIAALAGVTVERWFHPHTMEAKGDVVRWMVDMVARNSVQGFRYGCQALWGYNMRDDMKACVVPGLFVVGDGDGKGALVKAMEGFKGLLGDKGAELKIVDTAGHLPMCEAPEGFWEAIREFL